MAPGKIALLLLATSAVVYAGESSLPHGMNTHRFEQIRFHLPNQRPCEPARDSRRARRVTASGS